MSFKNAKFKFIFATAYYGAFALAAVVMLIVGCVVDAALLSLAASFFTLAVPYLFYFAAEKSKNEKMKFILGIVGNALLHACMLMLVLVACLGTAGALPYRPFALTVLLGSVFSLTVYSLKSMWIDENVGYILAFALPAFSLLGGFLFDLFLPLYVSLSLVAALYITYIALCFGNKEVPGSFISQMIVAGAVLITCIVYSVVCASELRFDKYPLHTLIFLPILMMLFYPPTIVGYIKKENDHIVYYTIMTGSACVALVFTQYLFGAYWWAGIIVFSALFLAQTILNEIFGNAKRRRVKREPKPKKVKGEAVAK